MTHDTPTLNWEEPVMGVKELTGVEPLMEPGRVLPEHLIDDIVSVKVERRGRNPPLGLSSTESVRGQNHDVTHADEVHAKLTEQSSSARANDDELETVKSDRVNRGVCDLGSGEEWRKRGHRRQRHTVGPREYVLSTIDRHTR